jgi:transcriptional regulator with XRE-family HTH domain
VESFRDEIRRARVELGLSIRQVERDTGISRSFITGIEDGKWEPSPKTAKKLCEYFGVDAEIYMRDYFSRHTMRVIEKLEEEWKFKELPLEIMILKQNFKGEAM